MGLLYWRAGRLNAQNGGFRPGQWAYSPYAAWGSEVEYSDGAKVSFARRERPHLILDDAGFPTHLVSGVQPGGVTGDYSYTLVQPTAVRAAQGRLSALSTFL
jgi:hypothetical protein